MLKCIQYITNITKGRGICWYLNHFKKAAVPSVHFSWPYPLIYHSWAFIFSFLFIIRPFYRSLTSIFSQQSFVDPILGYTERQTGEGGPCWLLKLRWMGTQGLQMKGVLPWLVCWACLAGSRDFCSSLAALVGPVKNIFSSPYTISITLSPSASKLDTWAGIRAGSPFSRYVSLVIQDSALTY